MRDGKTIFQKAILPCFGAFNVASFFLFMRLNGRLLILERRLILELRSSIVAVMGQFLYCKGSRTQSRRSPAYVSGYYFSVYLSSNFYLSPALRNKNRNLKSILDLWTMKATKKIVIKKRTRIQGFQTNSGNSYVIYFIIIPASH